MGFMGRDQGYLLWGECPLYGRSILLILPSCNGLLPPPLGAPLYTEVCSPLHLSELPPSSLGYPFLWHTMQCGINLLEN